MKRILAATAVSAVLLVGCGEPAKLSVAEYAEQCGVISGAVGDTETFTKWGQWQDSLGSYVNDIVELNPPDELAEYHAAHVQEMSAFADAVKDFDSDDAYNPMALMGFAMAAQSLSEKSKATYEALASETKQALIDTGCRNVDE